MTFDLTEIKPKMVTSGAFKWNYGPFNTAPNKFYLTVRFIYLANKIRMHISRLRILH